jgi:carbonic anhydrase
MKIVTLACSLALGAMALVASEGHQAHWGYTGKYSPEHWGDISPETHMCKAGKNQSPINITKSVGVDAELEAIGFHYKSAAHEVLNNGHTIQVNVEGGSFITVDGIDFELKQFHFHTPSENTLEGQSFPLEAHFVHAAKDGSLAVVAVLFKEGKENAILSKVWHAMPHKAGASKKMQIGAKELNAFLPKERDYFRFEGSLTTPPCSEGVRWLVLKEQEEASKEQVAKFLHVMHHPNNRPVQPIGARRVIY